MPADQIQYSEKYCDDVYEFRHVILPPDLTKHVPKCHLMTETEWRNLGIQQSPGWVHYMMHVPEPHVILFRRKREDSPPTTTTTTTVTTINIAASVQEPPQQQQQQHDVVAGGVAVEG